MDHTPTTAATDDRPLRILERTPVDDAHKQRLFALVRTAQEAASAQGAELQAEFGPEHVGLIVGCNQFVRLFRGGAQPGVVELLVPESTQVELRTAGFTLQPPEGAVFKLFGWVRLDPMQGDEQVLRDSVSVAFAKAKAAKKK